MRDEESFGRYMLETYGDTPQDPCPSVTTTIRRSAPRSAPPCAPLSGTEAYS